MKNLISASRRTDVPSFYSAWFINRLHAGFVYVKNPYNATWKRVSLKSEDISGIVFWSKNFSPLLPRLGEVEKTTKNLFFQFTITANNMFEPFVPDYKESVRDLVWISKKYSPDHIVWRFDPVIIGEDNSFEDSKASFAKLLELLKGHVRLCYISFVQPYRKIIGKLADKKVCMELDINRQRVHADELAEMGKGYGISIFACCNDYLLSDSVGKGACIDGGRLANLFGEKFSRARGSTRKECGCTLSVDIGAYNSCAHGCLYCYANNGNVKNLSTQNSDWNSLGEHYSVMEKPADE